MFQVLDLSAGQRGVVWFHHPGIGGMPSHHHAELECNLVMAGHARYLLADGSFDLAAGSLVWLFPGQEHVLVERSADFRMWIVVWSPELVAELAIGDDGLPTVLAEDDPSGHWFRRLGRGATASLARLCEEVAAIHGGGRCADAGLAWLLVSAWQAGERAELLAPGEPANPAVRKALFLLAGADPPLDLPALARTCGLSPDRLGRLFHRDTGITVSAYRNRLRCERACELMLAGEDDLTSVAVAAGFGSYAHFHRAFSREFGRSPGRWRDRP